MTGADELDLAGDQVIHRDPCPRIQGFIQLGALTCTSKLNVTMGGGLEKETPVPGIAFFKSSSVQMS